METNREELLAEFIQDEVLINTKMENRDTILNSICMYRNIQIVIVSLCIIAILIIIFINQLDTWFINNLNADKYDVLIVLYSFTILLYFILELTINIKHRKYVLLSKEIADTIAKYKAIIFK